MASQFLTPEAKAVRREAILKAAVTLMLTRGPRVDMDEIAKAAGTSKGGVYYYFQEKAELVERVREWAREAMLGGIADRERPIPQDVAEKFAHLLLEIAMLDREAFARRFARSQVYAEVVRWVTEDMEVQMKEVGA